MKLALVIPNWNGEGHLRRLFPTLHGQRRRAERVVVVDNGSADGSVAYARGEGAEVLELPRNLGFAAAVNRGVALTGEPLVGIFNNDVTLEVGYLEALCGAVEGGAAFATGKIYRAGGAQGVKNVLDGTWDLLTRGALAVRCGNGCGDGVEWGSGREIAMAPLTAAVFRREVWEEAGGLDERFESYLEDVDLGLRCALLGRRGRFVPESRAEHWGSGTLGVWHGETVRRMARNQVYLVAKHYPRGWEMGLGWPVLAGQLLWGLSALKHGRGWPWLAGKWEGLQRFREIRGNEGRTRTDRVAALLNQFEEELIELQMKTGTDRFWSWYFRWTR